jgi:hypothetical protein
LRMDVDRREINRLHLPAPAAIDINPAIACLACACQVAKRKPSLGC